MRRESVATDPLAQFSSQQQVYNSLPPAPSSVDRTDHSSPPQSRTLPAAILSDDENAEIMMNIFLSKCRFDIMLNTKSDHRRRCLISSRFNVKETSS